MRRFGVPCGAALIGLIVCGACHSSSATSADGTPPNDGGSTLIVQSPVSPDAPCNTPPGMVVKLFTGAAWSYGVDDAFLYVNDDARIEQVPIAGGAPTAFASPTNSDGEFQFALGGGSLLYPTAALTLGTAPLPNDPASPPTFSRGISSILAYDGAALYFGRTAPGRGVLTRIPVDGSPPTSVDVPQGGVSAMAAGNDGLYFAVGSVSTDAGFDGTLMKWATATGAITTLVEDIGEPFAVTVDDAYVYFIGVHKGRETEPIFRAALDGTGAIPLTELSGPSFTGTLAVDAHSVYFVADDSIAKVDKGGGAVTKLADFGQGQPKILVRGGNVYWGAPELSDDNGAPMPPGVWTICK